MRQSGQIAQGGRGQKGAHRLDGYLTDPRLIGQRATLFGIVPPSTELSATISKESLLDLWGRIHVDRIGNPRPPPALPSWIRPLGQYILTAGYRLPSS